MTNVRRVLRVVRLPLLVAIAAVGLCQTEVQPYFALSSFRTYGSNGNPTVNVSATNVKLLQFRVYRVNDPERFFQQLEDPHNFSEFIAPQRGGRSMIERFHRWKSGLRAGIRRSLRDQFTDAPSGHFPALFSKEPAAQPASGKGTRYAEAPVINPQQLVLAFPQAIQSKRIWEQSTVEVPVKEKGVYLVEAVSGPLRAYTILLVSDTAMITKDGGGKIVNFVVDRNTGKPLPHVRVAAFARNQTLEEAETNDEGVAELHPTTSWSDEVRVIAHNGRDVAANVVPGGRFFEADRWTGYIYTDRPVYRPNQTVHFKGIVRVRTANGYEIPAGKRVKVEIQDPDQKPVYQRTLTVSPNGTLRDDLTLAANASLGFYFLQVTYEESRMSGNFEVQEYKKPEYEVHVTPTAARVLQGERIQATIDARYYFGEPVAGAKVKYSVYRSRYWSPLLYDADDEEVEPANTNDDSDDAGDQLSEQEGQLGADGKLVVSIPTSVSDRKYDYRYRIQAQVADSANREIEGFGNAIATYAWFLVKVAPQRFFYEPGAKATFTVQARDYNNQPVKAHARVELLSWNYREPDRSELKGATEVDLDANGSAVVTMDIPPQGGSYRVRATARGPSGRQPEGTSALWVSGGNWISDSGENPSVQIIPDKKTYAAGDTAKLLIAAGQPGTSVYVAIEGVNLRQFKLLRSQESTVSFEIPITVRDEPGVAVSAVFLRDGVLHSGSKFVRVPPVQHQMNVSVKTDKPQYLPGQTAEYNIQATTADGKPVAGAEFSLGVVDEAIYGIRQDTMTPILDFFFARDYDHVLTNSSLEYFFNGQSGKRQMPLAELRPASRLAQLKPDRLVLPKIRKIFPDTAFWNADVVTDDAGNAHARVEFPGSVTRLPTLANDGTHAPSNTPTARLRNTAQFYRLEDFTRYTEGALPAWTMLCKSKTSPFDSENSRS